MMFLTSGLGFSELTWVTFHSGYDFGFLLKILTQHPLPPDLKSFMRHLTYYFGCRIFDIKYGFKIFNLHGGLEKVAKTLNVARVTGLSHQAGSDSLLILRCFIQIKDTKAFKQLAVTEKERGAKASFGNGHAPADKSWRKSDTVEATADADHQPQSAEKSENGHVAEN
ncbi:putative CCR4-associated factor 1 -like protein [Gossypium arboreum]|uniref:Putative CCR4-associated factor 1-like protein n=1 Tax=Gossypium arboreum TaxID=29729 RepID=A0A0B0MKS1_GOSAR|nr:putative CCR4-associated factor 1 -like protein [Gossypium arboreum]